MPSRDRRFMFTRVELQDASDALARFTAGEDDQTFPLKKEELEAAKQVVRLAAKILRDVFEDEGGESEDFACEAIFDGKFRRVDEILERQNGESRKELDAKLDAEESQTAQVEA